jgi:chitinase
MFRGSMLTVYLGIKAIRGSGKKHPGPYLRPHVNLTEIEESLDLLWRAGVDPSKVVLGLGWYGRSFTLSDPSCNVPNRACMFTESGRPGECTESAGILTNAEINRIIARGGVTKGFDLQAAVKWITWDSNQWVSYDDGETIQLKINHANKRCLAGKMIWAANQDDSRSSSTDDLLGIGSANGVSAENAQKAKDSLNKASETAAIGSSCYWTSCSEFCKSGDFGVTGATGQITGMQQDTECPEDQGRMLCCIPGTAIGHCSWDGWRGVGLSCVSRCEDPSATIVARNSNFAEYNCNGGYQVYCCSGFVPSSKTNIRSLSLIDQGEIMKRGMGSGAGSNILGTPACFAVASIIFAIFLWATTGLYLLFGAPVTILMFLDVFCPVENQGFRVLSDDLYVLRPIKS